MQSVNIINNKFTIVNSNRITIYVCVITIILAQLAEKSNSFIWMILAYFLIISWALICNSKQLFGMCLFLLSDNSIIDVGEISIQLVLMFIYIIRFVLLKRKIFYKKIFYYGLLISLYSMLFYEKGLNCVLQGVKLALMISFFTELYTNKKILNPDTYEYCIKYLVYGLVTSVLVTIAINPNSLENNRFALSKDSNWNMLGILASLVFSHCFLLYLVKTEKKYLLYVFFMFACVLISSSRTAALVILISLLWNLLFINNKQKILIKKAIIIFVIILLVILVFLGTIHNSFIDKIIDRIINPRRGDISNGRFTLWKRYIHYLQNNPKVLILGNGKSLVDGITTLISTESSVAHNMYIEQIVMYGLLGNIIVFFLYWYSYVIIKKVFIENMNIDQNLKKKYMINIVLVFIVGIFSHLLTSVLVTTELYLGIMQYLVISLYSLDSNEGI